MNPELIKKIENTNWWQADGPCSGKLVEVPMIGFLLTPKYFPGIDFWGVIAVVKNDHGYQFMDENNNIAFVSYILEHFKKDKEYFNKKLKIWQGWRKKLNSYCQRADKTNLKDLENRKILELFEELSLYITEAWAIPLILEGNGIYFEKKLLPEIAKKYNLKKDEVSEKLASLIASKKPSVAKSEHLGILSLAKDFLRNKIDPNVSVKNLGLQFPNIAKKLSEHQQKYFWMLNNYQDNVILDESHFLDEIREVIAKKKLKAINLEMGNLSIKKLILKQEKIKKELKLDQETLDILNLFSVFSWVMDERKKDMLIGTHYLAELLKEIARRLKWDYKNVYYLTNEEIKAYLQKNIIPDQKQAESRRSLVVMIYRAKNCTQEMFLGKEAKEYDRLIFQAIEKINTRSELRGMIACRGNFESVEGEVNIVRNVRLDPFKEGTILVTSMTRPEFVPLLKKAKAVITDEGGITSHAAIVSRELNIPCIIGTKVASSKLKNGDTVSMNMQKGLIKIIEG